jgi:hypothetical protein
MGRRFGKLKGNIFHLAQLEKYHETYSFALILLSASLLCIYLYIFVYTPLELPTVNGCLLFESTTAR